MSKTIQDLPAVKLYGIANCDQVKKARNWLTTSGIEHTFFDFKKTGVTRVNLQKWIDRTSWERLVNRKGTTWRGLNPIEQAKIVDAEHAIELMMASTSIIKRPVLEFNDTVLVGFDATLYDIVLNTAN